MKSNKYFKISERKILLRVVDALVAVFSLYVGYYYLNLNYVVFDSEKIILRLIALVVYLFLFGQIFQFYSLNIASNRYRIVQSCFLTLFMTTIFYILTPFFTPVLPEDRFEILFFFLLLFFPILLWRYAYMVLLFSPKFFKMIVVVAHSSNILKIKKIIHNDHYHNVSAYLSDKNDHEIENYFSIGTNSLIDIVDTEHVNEIIVSRDGFSESDLIKLDKDIVLLFEKGINIKSYETFYEENTQSIPREYLDDQFYNKISLSKNNDSRFYNFFHRTIDVVISIIGLIIFLIILPLIIILNLFGNRGSLFYTQDRVGAKGRVFRIFKLRTMIPNAEKNGVQFTVKNDKRITAFGKFLRNTRIDEMPQFVNILKGDMSLIGPRPERPEVVKVLEEQIPFYAIRHVVKPGLTGWAQVSYPYAGTTEEQMEKLRYDLFYVKQQSPFLDFKIIIKTITTVLLFRGQ